MRVRRLVALLAAMLLCMLVTPAFAWADEATVEGDFTYPAPEGYYHAPTGASTTDHVVAGDFLLHYNLTVRCVDPNQDTFVYIRAWEDGTPEEDGLWHEIRGFSLDAGEDQELEVVVYTMREESGGKRIRFISDFGESMHPSDTIYLYRTDAESVPVHISLGGQNAVLANVRSSYSVGDPQAEVDRITNSWGLGRLFSILSLIGKALVLLVVECIIIVIARSAGMSTSRGAAVCCVVSMLVFGLSVSYLVASFVPGGLETVNGLIGKASRLIGGDSHIMLVPEVSPFHIPALVAAVLGAIVSLIVFFLVCVPNNLFIGILLLPLGAYVQLAGFFGFLVYIVAYAIMAVGLWYISIFLRGFEGVEVGGGTGGGYGGGNGSPSGFNDYATGEDYSVWTSTQYAGGTYAKLRDSSGNLVDARRDSNGTWYRLDDGSPLDEY